MKKILGKTLPWIVILGMIILLGTGCQGQEEDSEPSATNGEGSQEEDDKLTEEVEKEDREENPFVVILDPGHGGEETGRQAFGYDEKDLNNQLTEKIANELEAKGVTLKFTRHYSEDYDLSLSERVEAANEMEADFFLSIHHDGSIHTEARGVTVFYSTYRPLISFENAYLRNKDREEVYDLIGEIRNQEGRKDYVYLDDEGEEAYADPSNDSLEPFEEEPSEEALLSEVLAGELAEALAETGLWMRGPIDDPYYVVRRSVHPAVLIEVGFMTNEEDLTEIIDPEVQQQRAEAIADTVYNFLMERREKGM